MRGNSHRVSVSTLREADVSLILAGLLVMGLVYPVQTLRWLLLLRARGIETDVWRTYRLIMVSLFFNVCMPGTTGGDVVKAYYAANRSDRRADALMTIVFDRLSGLLGLLVFAGLIGLINFRHPLTRSIAVTAWSGLLAATLVYFCYSSHRLRVLLGAIRLDRLPMIGRILATLDAAAVAYRRHLGVVAAAIAISAACHLALSLAMLTAAMGLGMKAPAGMLMTVTPALVLAGSLPVSYQGIGVQEGVAQALIYDPPYVTMNQIVVMLMIFRLYILFYALCGSSFLLRGDIHLRAAAEFRRKNA